MGAGLVCPRIAPVDGFDGHLAGEGRSVRLPGRDLALAALARGGRGVKALPDGLVDGLDVEAEQGADAGAAADGPRWATWSILCLCRQIARTRSIWIS